MKLLKRKILKSIHITENYLKEVLVKRKELQVKLTEESQKGNTAYLNYDKVIVKNENEKHLLHLMPIILISQKTTNLQQNQGK